MLCVTRCRVRHAGASFFYQPGGAPFEAQEVRAFGLMLADMAARIPGVGVGGKTAGGGRSAGSGDVGGSGSGAGGLWSRFSSSLGVFTGATAVAGAEADTPAAQPDAGSGSPAACGSGDGVARQLAALAAECTQRSVSSRPSFSAIVDRLQSVSASVA